MRDSSICLKELNPCTEITKVLKMEIFLMPYAVIAMFDYLKSFGDQ